ncbi:MAG: hypothetical protein NZ602_09755 [Thermoguttaceae bacterium]|nr:hypothetical protein [Thermoguttaceae bacterium]
MTGILELVRRYRPPLADRTIRPWDQPDAFLITYADQIRSDSLSPVGPRPISSGGGLEGLLTGIHLLPFSPIALTTVFR